MEIANRSKVFIVVKRDIGMVIYNDKIKFNIKLPIKKPGKMENIVYFIPPVYFPNIMYC